MKERSYYPLSALREGERAIIETLLATDSIRRRLLDIGMVPGTQVTCLQKSPAGDPVAYLIRGAVMAIRSEDAERISVRRLPEKQQEMPQKQRVISWD